eukprot:gene14247-20220_t
MEENRPGALKVDGDEGGMGGKFAPVMNSPGIRGTDNPPPLEVKSARPVHPPAPTPAPVELHNHVSTLQEFRPQRVVGGAVAGAGEGHWHLQTRHPMPMAMTHNLEALGGPRERVALTYDGDPQRSLGRLHDDIMSSYRMLCQSLGEPERADLINPAPYSGAGGYNSRPMQEATPGKGGGGAQRWGQQQYIPGHANSLIPVMQGPSGNGVRVSSISTYDMGGLDGGMKGESTMLYPPAGASFEGPGHVGGGRRGPGIDTLEDFKYRKPQPLNVDVIGADLAPQARHVDDEMHFGSVAIGTRIDRPGPRFMRISSTPGGMQAHQANFRHARGEWGIDAPMRN